MHEQCDTQDVTLDNYGGAIRALLTQFGAQPEWLDARSLRRCFLAYGKSCARIKHGATALRMFVRFLTAERLCLSGLEAAIPLVPHWRLSSLPRYLQTEEVEHTIASCDPTTAVGKRERVIFLLLARLGLRAGDVVQLHLVDIDWKHAWVHVCGKGHRPACLPLTQEIGDALVANLVHGRLLTNSDRIFVRCRAPFRAFTGHSTISMIVARAMSGANVRPPCRSAAHLRRHSVATSLLRHGISLQGIAAVLRHRSIQTTQIYAKVDMPALLQIAQHWPEVQSC